MAIKSKTLTSTAKGMTGGQKDPCTGCQPIRKVLSSNAAEARMLPKLLALRLLAYYNKVLSFSLVLLLNPCCKIQTWFHSGARLDDICGRHC